MTKNQDTIKIRGVKKEDLEFLYQLLQERDPKANISHVKMPTYEQHVRFVLSKPYSKWYVAEKNGKKIGSVYLTKNNEIGIFLKKNFQGKNLAKKILKLLITKNPRKWYLANVSPKNKKSIHFFKKNKFKLIQYTYELRV